MLSTKFQFIRESSFRGEDFFQKSTNLKQKWFVAAMFVNVSGRNWQSLQRTFHRCFLRENFKTSANQKQELPVAATFVNGSGQNEQPLQRTSPRCFLPNFSSFGQAVSEEKILKNRPIRNKNCLWWPCLVMDHNKIWTLQKGPSIDASYQVSVHLAEGFQRRRLKCEK